jgi:IclR family transcriptional regulator, KDG regulon repressor
LGEKLSQTLERALTILNFVAKEPRRIGEIAVFLGVHHSTALRLLQSLRKQRFVFELPDHRYRLGSATFRLGFQALEALDLRTVAHPFMEKLNSMTGETVHLATLEGDDITYIDKVEAKHAVRMHSRVGTVANLHSAAVAKAILAYLPFEERELLLRGYVFDARTKNSLTSRKALEADIAASRRRGYVLDAEENETGIHCVGMPIFDGAGQVAGSMSVSTPMSRISREALIGFVPSLREATESASRELGWEPNVPDAPDPRRGRMRRLKRLERAVAETSAAIE